ncbi:BEST2 [Symbiodinium pilosum]|uniref:BEST2 protein n=1 Tax=Symbiodinium pilosum TaxID=2952 RepID=A0A812Y0A4_SYMPI|nr:BEST2 [Symbiodinium pilosum]
MLRYNADRSLSFQVIFMFQHTLLSNSQILRHMLVSVLVAALLCFVHIAARIFVDVEILQGAWLQDLDNMSDFLTSLIGILLGFYISTVMTRWWSMRSQGIGGLWGGVVDLCILTGSFFPGPEWRTMRSMVLRYGLVSFELTFMQNEGRDEELEGLVQRHLLTRDEAARLAGQPSKCGAVWAWVAWIYRELQKQGHLSDIDLRLFLEKVLQARGGTGSLLTHIDTQLPFLYVQLLSSLVHFLTMVMAADCGVMTGAWLISPSMGSPVLKFVQMLMVTYFYNGCLEIGRSFANPCGHDFSDFPRHAYHFWMRNEAEFFHSLLEQAPQAGVEMLQQASRHRSSK